MTADYWLGVATPFVVALAGFVALEILDWVLWWRRDPNVRLGRGRAHEVETIYPECPEGEQWGRVQHTHYWPPGTPWWLIHRMEWLRVRLCVRRPEYRPAAERGPARVADESGDAL